MTRWDRNGSAAPTGFSEVKEGAAQPAQAIDRRRKERPRFPGSAGRRGAISSSVRRPTPEPASSIAAPCLIFSHERRRLTGLQQECPRRIDDGQEPVQRRKMNERRSILLAEDNLNDVEQTLAGLSGLTGTSSAPFDVWVVFGPGPTSPRSQP